MARDYVADNLEAPKLDRLFPNMAEFDRSVTTWPWLGATSITPIGPTGAIRSSASSTATRPRSSTANARLFAGRAGFEIGAWRGWSTAHLIACGPRLPACRRAAARRPRMAGGVRSGGARRRRRRDDDPRRRRRARRRSYASAKSGARWSFAFIDGDHDGEAPTRDALASPALSRADRDGPVPRSRLAPCRQGPARARASRLEASWPIRPRRWSASAWRGDVAPVAHTPDPTQSWSVPEHLSGIPIAGVARR